MLKNGPFYRHHCDAEHRKAKNDTENDTDTDNY